MLKLKNTTRKLSSQTKTFNLQKKAVLGFNKPSNLKKASPTMAFNFTKKPTFSPTRSFSFKAPRVNTNNMLSFSKKTTMPLTQSRNVLTLPPLPYAKNALAPTISEETVKFHYEKHHQGYVTKFNAKAPEEYKDITQPMQVIQKGKSAPLFNLAAQVENHTFYWNSMAQAKSAPFKPDSKIGKAIISSFGDFNTFQQKFEDEGANHFGSGWVWLVREKDNNNLKVLGTHDAEHPALFGYEPVLTCDVWEHAFYIDYRNDKPGYLKKWWDLVNWNFAEQNLV